MLGAGHLLDVNEVGGLEGYRETKINIDKAWKEVYDEFVKRVIKANKKELEELYEQLEEK